jgi:hypothetical protein
MHTDRQIAVWGGWIAGPAFGVAMMAAPEYLHLKPALAAWFFWGGNLVFVLTVFVVAALQSRDREQGRKSMWPIVVMAVGVIIFGVGAAWHFWPARGGEKETAEAGKAAITKTNSSLDGTLRLECVSEEFKFPADGKLLELIASDDAARTISFQSHWLSEYSYKTKPDIIPTRGGIIDRCRLTNFGQSPVFNVKISVKAQFSEHIPLSAIMTEQRIVDVKQYDFVVPQVDPGPGGSVDFYMWSYTKYSVSLMFADKVELQKLGGKDRETVQLIPAHNFVTLWPPQTLSKQDAVAYALACGRPTQSA